MLPKRAILLLALALVFCGAPARGQNKTGEDFPLTRGTYWVYQGTVRYWVKGLENGKIAHVTWKTSVTRGIQRDGLTIAVVKGMPGDLDWSEGNATPSLSILIRTQDAKFYLLEDDEARAVIPELDNPHYSWRQVPVDHDWFLQLPLAKGKKFCEAERMQRTDDHYCWVTGPARAVRLAGVRGVQPGRYIAHRVEYFTNPDDNEFDFVPGIGMVSYEYHHHGTTADTELHLVEFHDGSTP
jgi:hypothetical protein